MLKFFRNTTFTFLALVIFTAMLVYLGIVKSQLMAPLFPEKDHNFPWARSIEPQLPVGKTLLSLKNETGVVEYDFYLDSEKPYPYTHYSMYFSEADDYKIVDLSRYDSISFKVICDPKNVLLMVLFSFDDKVTHPRDTSSRRFSRTAFSCDNHWKTLTIKFNSLDTPHWWLAKNGFELSDEGYALDKTMGFAWVNSSQSPLNTLSHVRLTDIKLQGKDYRYLYAVTPLLIAIWIVFLVIAFRTYLNVMTLELKEKLIQDQQFIAYKKLSIEPQKDKTKSALLRFMATEYANPDLSLESTANALGSNRSKINDILKDELGLTFTAYLNKLRLTEAARLFSEIDDANISEIAYSVGYNNISYFNKLFKQKYGCTPKTFKSLYQHEKLSK
jgi:AraC-like DNA-binding protein